MRLLSSLLLGAALVGASAPVTAAPSASERGEAQLQRALEGRVAGNPVDCIMLNTIQSSEIIDRTAILYRVAGGRLYVNRPTTGQSSLDRYDILLTKTSTPELCSVDTVSLIDPGSHMWSGFVGLGKFVPYSRPARD